MKRDILSTRSERPQGPLTDLERSEFYLREAERLAHMGSWSLRADGVFDYWSPEAFVNFGFDPNRGILTLSQWLDITMPEETLKALADHGDLCEIMSDDGGDCETVLDQFAAAGIHIDDLAARLQDDGAKSFVSSWKELMEVIASKGATLAKAG